MSHHVQMEKYFTIFETLSKENNFILEVIQVKTLLPMLAKVVKELWKIKFDDTDKIVELELESSCLSIQEDQKIFDELGFTLAKSCSFHGRSSGITPRRTESICHSSRVSSQAFGNI